jgi:hypothetical protein
MSLVAQDRYRAEASLVGKKCARMSADFRCGRHVESNQSRGNFIGVNMAEYALAFHVSKQNSWYFEIS